MRIKRDLYLQRLIDKKDNGLIKIITGIRRCGKSYLLFEIFRSYLLDQGIRPDHLIAIALDDRRNKELRDPDQILSYLIKEIKDKKKYYIILDEVQIIPEFEDVLNSLLHIKNVDVYVTGSNSKFLSSDIITEFRGRGDEIRIHPLSFKEFVSVRKEDFATLWDEYFTYGGLPQILSMPNKKDKIIYLKNLLAKVYITDIIDRNKVQNKEEMEDLLNILASSVGGLTNPAKIANTFCSVKKTSTSNKTVGKYIDYLLDGFLLSKAMRYDLKGRRYINAGYKYYFTDVGLRNARLNFRQIEENHIMENIIYNELLIRGFNVDVGSVEINTKSPRGSNERKQLEVDFVANLGSIKYYLQSALTLHSEEKIRQEKQSLRNIDDSFKKIIIVQDAIQPRRDEDGIVTISLKDFLLLQNSLEL